MLVISCAGSNKSGGENKNDLVYQAYAAERAAFDLSCPESSIETQMIGGGGNSIYATVGVIGCGQKASYLCQCDGGGNFFGVLVCDRAVCVMDASSVAAPAPAPAPAPSTPDPSNRPPPPPPPG